MQIINQAESNRTDVTELKKEELLYTSGGVCNSWNFMKMAGCMAANFKRWASTPSEGSSFCGSDARSCAQMP